MADRKNHDPKTIARTSPLVGVSRPALGTSKLQEAILLLDTSGSMAGAKIDELNAAVVGCVAELAKPSNRGTFHLSPIAYAERARVLFDRRPAGDLGPADLAVAVGPEGSNTNIGAALTEALALVERTPPNWLRPVVVLLSDGHNGQGADPVALAAQVRAKADVVACGFGADADMALLQRLASGPEHAIPCSDGAALRRFFATVGMSLSIAARTGQKVTAILGASKVQG